MQQPNQDIGALIHDLESRSENLSAGIDRAITEESGRMSRFKKRLVRFAVGTALIVALACSGVYAYRSHQHKELIAAQGQYYEVSSAQNLKEIAHTICGDRISIGSLIAFNRQFDKSFDASLSPGEIVHFPKAAVANPGTLGSFSDDARSIDSRISNYETEISQLSREIQKKNVDRMYDLLARIDRDIQKYGHWSGNESYGSQAAAMIARLTSSRTKLTQRIDALVSQVDEQLRKMNSSVSTVQPRAPGALQKLEQYATTTEQIASDYRTLRETQGASKATSLTKEIKKKEDAYLSIVKSIQQQLQQDSAVLVGIEERISQLFSGGFPEHEMKLLYSSIVTFNEMASYADWDDEPRLTKLISAYRSKRSGLRDKLNGLFDAAARSLNRELKDYEEEIAIGEETGRIWDADARLSFLLNNPLAELNANYHALGYREGICRIENLIEKINAYL